MEGAIMLFFAMPVVLILLAAIFWSIVIICYGIEWIFDDIFLRFNGVSTREDDLHTTI